MEHKNEKNSVREQILALEAQVDRELEKPPDEVNMAQINAYFREIRELDGGIFEKDDQECARELQALYRKAAVRKKRTCPRYVEAARRAASILIAVGVLFGLSAGVYAAREPIVTFLTEVKEKYTEFFFREEDVAKAPARIETVYTLGFVPEGYELESEQVWDEHIKYTWKNADGNLINFTQGVLDGKMMIDNETEEVLTFSIGEQQIFATEKYGTKIYFWNTNDYSYDLRVHDDDISIEEGLELIRSVTERKK